MIRINTYNQLFSDCSHASTRNGLLSAYLMALIFLCEYLQQDLANTYRNACGCRTRQPNIPAKPMSKDHIESKLLNSHQACRIAHHHTNLLFVHIFDLARQDGHGVEGSTLHDPGPVCGPPRKRKVYVILLFGPCRFSSGAFIPTCSVEYEDVTWISVGRGRLASSRLNSYFLQCTYFISAFLYCMSVILIPLLMRAASGILDRRYL